jgi:hypothetical protein
VLHGVLVVAYLEVCQAEVIVKLGIIFVDSLRFFKGCDSQDVLTLLIHSDAIVEERLPRRGMVLLEVLLAHDCKPVPILGIEHVQADFLKSDLFL